MGLSMGSQQKFSDILVQIFRNIIFIDKSIFLILCISSISFAETSSTMAVDSNHFTQECHDFENTRAVYCVNRVKGSTSQDVVYFFHGIFMTAKDWPMSSAIYDRVSKNWFKLGVRAPIVISISYGPIWMAVRKNTSPLSGRRDEIANRVIPGIEKSLRLNPTSRVGFGASMGGFNLTQITLRYPYLFNRVALVCPAILNLSPYASFSQVSDFVQLAQSRGTDAKRIYVLMYQIFGLGFLPNENEWSRVNIFNIVKYNIGQLPPLFISTGRSDPYGFFEGSKDFVEVMQRQNRSIQWHPVEGKHCSFDSESLNKFLFD